jgi:hypothetical protein
MLELQARLRILLKEREPDQRRRAALLRRCLEDEALWEALERGEREAAWKRARDLTGLGDDAAAGP